jgi:PAS domain S-box-containing protein
MNEKVNSKEQLVKVLNDLRQEHDKLVKSYETFRTEVRKDEELILKLLTAINTTSDAIFLTDIEGVITYINSGFTTLYGYTSAEVVGKVTPRIIKSGLLDKEVYEGFWGTLKNKTEVKGEILNKRKNGELVIIDGTASPIFDDQNTIIGFIGIQRDINERKQTEKALLESEKKFRTLVEYVGEGIGFVSPDEEFLFANSAAERIFGVGKGELLGKNLKEFLSEDQYLSILNQTKIRTKGQNSIYEFELTRTDGKKRNVLITAVPQFNDNNKFIGTHGIFRDFTERKNMEEALRESESSLRNAQEIAKMGSWELDVTNQKVKWSENCFVIYGIKPFEIEPTFEYFKSRVHPDDLHLVDESFENTVRNKETFIPEMRIIFPDGTFKWFQTNIVPIFQDDKLVALHGINLDITERKQAEKDLQKSEEKFSSIMENSADAIFISTQQGKYVYTNKAVSVLLGYTSEEMKSKTIVDLSPPNKIEAYFEFFKKILSEGKGFAEVELLKKDGYFISTDLNTVLLPDGMVYGSCRDITERKQVELALKESEEKYKSLIETSNIGIGLSKGDKSIFANTALQEISGYAENEIIINSFIDLFHPDDKPLVIERMKKRRMGELIPNNLQARIIRKNGDILYAEIGTSAFFVNDEQYVQATFIDITERMLAEQALKESETKLRQLNVDKDLFISILSHDLKNPFNNILGFSEVLTTEINSLNSDEIKDIANNINKSARNTYNLLEDILMWARTQQGKIPFKPQNLSFADICKNILEILNPIANAKNITINCFTAKQMNVFADIDMLKTVLRNLVSNAIKFTNIGGSININAEETSGNVTISVSDNGTGIKPDDLKKLFNISEFITTTGTAEETGTGFGLLLCKEFVEKHGGKIWVESVYGKGSEFKFSLPYNAKPDEVNVVENITHSAVEDNKITNLKILITDDDETSRKFLGISVKLFAKEILYAKNGFEAVAACKNNSDIDLILMDIKMPEMDGFEATHQIRQFNKEVIIIVQTAYTGSGEKEKATVAGCSDFISKPINKTLLKELINKHCNK